MHFDNDDLVSYLLIAGGAYVGYYVGVIMILTRKALKKYLDEGK